MKKHNKRLIKTLGILAFSLTVGFALHTPHTAVQAKDKVEYVQRGQMQKDMNAAILKARSTLNTFWKKYKNPAAGERNFSLKVGIRDGGVTEHFWVVNIERKDGLAYGVISNDPNSVTRVRKGQKILIPNKDISDWTYISGNKIIGNRTLQVLMKYNPALKARFKNHF